MKNQPELFSYPGNKHLRTESPPPSRNYRDFRAYLSREFYRTCVYCRMPEWLQNAEYFGVDHYKPKSIFPSLVCEYANLFFACNACNRRKGNYWPTKRQRIDGDVVINPTAHQMNKHVSRVGGQFSGNSKMGLFTIDLLDLNQEDRVRYRSMLLELLVEIKNKARSISETLRELRTKIVRTNGPRKKLLEGKQLEQRHNLKRLEARINWLENGGE